MSAPWRVLALLAVVLWAVGSLPARSVRTTDDRVSQAGEVGTLLARRLEGANVQSERDDQGSGNPPPSVLASAPIAVDGVPSLPVIEHRSVDRIGATSPRGPPVLV